MSDYPMCSDDVLQTTMALKRGEFEMPRCEINVGTPYQWKNVIVSSVKPMIGDAPVARVDGPGPLRYFNAQNQKRSEVT